MRESWYNLRNDRQLRYAGRVLSPDRPILVQLEPNYAETFDGQVTAIVVANLLSRMTPAVCFDIPDAKIMPLLPWVGTELGDFIIRQAHAADPYASFEVRGPKFGDYVLTIGTGLSRSSVHGSGWRAFVGPGRSPIPPAGVANPFGPAFAAIVAVARLFALDLAPLDGPYLFDTFAWTEGIDAAHGLYPTDLDLGAIWTVGAGSVGTAALYFLTLATRKFSSLIFDMDEVKVENLDRSPIFVASDAEQKLRKADAATSYLLSVGVAGAVAECQALDESDKWLQRRVGEPDLLISAANERDVRYLIEQSCPPLQIYGTTGRNWVASVLRHIPLRDACSCCVFPPRQRQQTFACAEGKVAEPETGQEVDAALPFLSFAAGMMAAAEVVKSQLAGYPFNPNRTVLSVGPYITPRLTSLNSHVREQCVCQDRSKDVLRQMINGTRHCRLSLD